ncbi:MFS transporter [Sodalis sp.]|uniref:MFS transporter n=1 Tax=Sodalis sp. (in: enterobacteria) TaxID=1898979 RepID=UPI003873BDC0
MQVPLQVSHLHNGAFWLFALFLFGYFFIMAAYYPFFPLWLHDINQLSKSDTGLVFGSIALFALAFQPIMGPLSDKLGRRKTLIAIIVGLLVLSAPFFIYVFSPLLHKNIKLGALVGGAYLGFVFTGGSHALEAYVEKVSRHCGFEYGKARLFGCLGWALCASVVGLLFSVNCQWVFWLASGCALILVVLLWLARPDHAPAGVNPAPTPSHPTPAFSLKTAADLLKKPDAWWFMLYIIGVPCVYDVFDQQFANFFTSFFTTHQRGTQIFGFVTTGGEVLNALIMFFTPFIIGKIGSKNALLLAGGIMAFRIIGSAFATSAVEVILLKMLHMFEVPFLLVGSFKYITRVFEVRFSATVYLIGFCFSKQLSMIFMSYFAGRLYDLIGFRSTYLILGGMVLTFTLIAAFSLNGRSAATEASGRHRVH